MKKIWISFLFLVLSVAFVSCSGGELALPQTARVTENAAPSTTLEIAKNRESKFTIVHDGTEDAESFAHNLNGYIYIKHGVSLEIQTPEEGDGRYEIVIGNIRPIGEDANKKLASPLTFPLR